MATPPSADATRTAARVFVAGATGYIGRNVVRTLVEQRFRVVAFARRRAGTGGSDDEATTRQRLAGAEVRFGDVTNARSVRDDGFRNESFDAVVSCLATRTGGIQDAWQVEHQANIHLLEGARQAAVRHFVLLSAICVQKPKLAFQRAKLAFERTLIASGLGYSIVRPTAYFKSLSGQVLAVQRGRRFMVFGHGELTACKPISERDLAQYVAELVSAPEAPNRVLPIGGPGPAITPKQQGALLFDAVGRPPRYRHVPVALFDAIIFILGALSRLGTRWADRAEFARIARYYATESMLVWNETEGRYDAEATPSFGRDTLRAFYQHAVIDGLQGQELGEHAMLDWPSQPSPRGDTDAS